MADVNLIRGAVRTGYLYIHIPFCLKKCGYCDFYSIVLDDSTTAPYLDALKGELLLRRRELGLIRTIFIGGGTPALLEASALAALMAFIQRNFKLAPDVEVTIEANPLTIDSPKLDILRSSGINRLSLGVQSLDDGVLRTLGRLHDARQAHKAIEAVVRSFDNFSIDLIYAVPGQSLDSWRTTLLEVLSYTPAHVSAYELSIEPSVPLARAGLVLPSEDVAIGMFELVADCLTQSGYLHYEISNYARPYFQCFHNLNYWRSGQYVGIGAGAHSYVDGRRFSNVADVKTYIAAISASKLAIEGIEEVTPQLAFEESIFLGLRTTEGVKVAKSRIVSELETEGLVLYENGALRLTRKGMLLSNRVIAEVIQNQPPSL
ncbi:MAG: radical SAM family heme chaperone HemW [Nitrospirae bacterium]|nr:radical SAM family heme chaperone HemW [Nitrospirota bacterium]